MMSKKTRTENSLFKNAPKAFSKLIARIIPVRGLVVAVAIGIQFFGISLAGAKELTNRLGIGYADQFSIGVPAVAARYYPNPDFGVAASLGIDTASDASGFGLMGKVFRIIFKEPNLNFYMGGAAALISKEIVAGTTSSGFELNGYIGVEWFLPGLDSLGFVFETGIGIASINDGVRFRTYGDHPLKAGIFFYF